MSTCDVKDDVVVRCIVDAANIVHVYITLYVLWQPQPTSNIAPVDVHTYDRSIVYIPSHGCTREEVTESCRALHAAMTAAGLDNSGVQLCMRDVGTPHNMDTVNNMCADDLLCELWQCARICDPLTVYNCISEQLLDMHNTGQCGAGRTIRLYMLYCALNVKIEK